MRAGRCRSLHWQTWRFVRCAWPADHVLRSRWHCSPGEWVWLVTDRERRRFK